MIVENIPCRTATEFLTAIVIDGPVPNLTYRSFFYRGVGVGAGPNEHRLVPSSLRFDRFAELMRLSGSSNTNLDECAKEEWVQARLEARVLGAFFRYPLWLDENLEKNLAILDKAELPVYHLFVSVNVKPEAQPFDPRVPDSIRKLKGRPVTVTLLLQGLPPGDPKGEEQAVKILRQLGDIAAEADVRISIYHHTGNWTQSMLHAIEVIKKADHPRVGVNFNLCHWLMIDGDKDYRPVLRENAAKIFAVTINGATIGSKTWANGLIQPLDKGDFDNQELLALLKEIGYSGPIGLMCFGIGGDAREHLKRSIDTWNSWKQ